MWQSERVMKISIDNITDFLNSCNITEREKVKLIQELIEELEKSTSVKQVYLHAKQALEYETAPL
jgi:transcriptional/translational regulatory protein YebC/TACO1